MVKPLPFYYHYSRFTIYGLLFPILLLIFSLLGFSAYTRVLSGTGSGLFYEDLFGALYVLAYLGSVVLSPPLLFTSLLLNFMKIAPKIQGQSKGNLQ